MNELLYVVHHGVFLVIWNVNSIVGRDPTQLHGTLYSTTDQTPFCESQKMEGSKNGGFLISMECLLPSETSGSLGTLDTKMCLRWCSKLSRHLQSGGLGAWKSGYSDRPG